MLMAYFDEIGEPGAFVARTDPRYNTSAAFGYAGFVIPAANARTFAQVVEHKKRELFKHQIANAKHPGRYEHKGSSIFRPGTLRDHPYQIRVIDGLAKLLVDKYGGRLFYYADEKPIGTPRQTDLEVSARESNAMRESLNRIATHADHASANILIIMDQINESTRLERLPKMYSHILSRATDHREMKRIIEPPMHVDSQLSTNIQFADWIAACVSRAIDYQLLDDSPHQWVTTCQELTHIRGRDMFTTESKVHLWKRACADIHLSDVFAKYRPTNPPTTGQRVSDTLHQSTIQKIKMAADRSHRDAPRHRQNAGPKS